MIKEGTFKTVPLMYGNRIDQTLHLVLGNGWAFHSERKPDSINGSLYHFLTFVAGVDAKDFVALTHDIYFEGSKGYEIHK